MPKLKHFHNFPLFFTKNKRRHIASNIVEKARPIGSIVGFKKPIKRLNLDANVAGSYRTILLPSAKCNLSFGINILVCIENKHTKNAKLCPCLAMAKQASRRFRTFSKVSVDNSASGLP